MRTAVGECWRSSCSGKGLVTRLTLGQIRHDGRWGRCLLLEELADALDAMKNEAGGVSNAFANVEILQIESYTHPTGCQSGAMMSHAPCLQNLYNLDRKV